MSGQRTLSAAFQTPWPLKGSWGISCCQRLLAGVSIGQPIWAAGHLCLFYILIRYESLGTLSEERTLLSPSCVAKRMPGKDYHTRWNKKAIYYLVSVVQLWSCTLSTNGQWLYTVLYKSTLKLPKRFFIFSQQCFIIGPSIEMLFCGSSVASFQRWHLSMFLQNRKIDYHNGRNEWIISLISSIMDFYIIHINIY